MKLNENKKRDKNLELGRELKKKKQKKLWNIKVAVITVESGSHDTVSKGYEDWK